MPTKTVKSTRPTTAKKTTVKKAAAKKPAVKTTPAVAAAPAANCPCGANCKCDANCHCGADCKCTQKRGGCKFCRFLKKLVIFIIIFALGFATAKLCCCDKTGPKHFRGPRIHFVNNCMDVSSVKCPKLAEALPAMDINGDGCITREEYRAVKKQMRSEIRDMKVREME